MVYICFTYGLHMGRHMFTSANGFPSPGTLETSKLDKRSSFRPSCTTADCKAPDMERHSMAQLCDVNAHFYNHL